MSSPQITKMLGCFFAPLAIGRSSRPNGGSSARELWGFAPPFQGSTRAARRSARPSGADEEKEERGVADGTGGKRPEPTPELFGELFPERAEENPAGEQADPNRFDFGRRASELREPPSREQGGAEDPGAPTVE